MLDDEQKKTVHFILCDYALAILEGFFKGVGAVRYIESVTGTGQELDPALPADAFASAQAGKDLHECARRYAEPIAALQDDDLQLPGHIELGYYSVYNLFERYALGRLIDDWIIVNQALSIETNDAAWPVMLGGAINEVNEKSYF